MTLRPKRKNKFVAPAIIYFVSAPNEEGKTQICVVAECLYGGTRFGPVWSHTDKAVRRSLASLSKICECGRKFHKHRFSEGHRVQGHDAE